MKNLLLKTKNLLVRFALFLLYLWKEYPRPFKGMLYSIVCVTNLYITGYLFTFECTKETWYLLPTIILTVASTVIGAIGALFSFVDFDDMY